jgi:hypothetical protein
VAAVSLSGQASQMDLNRLSPFVAETARQASAALFPQDVATRRRKARADLPQPAPWPAGTLDSLLEGIGGDYWL